MPELPTADPVQVVRDNMCKILKAEEFEIKQANGKIYVDIFDKVKFFTAVAKSTAIKVKWPKNAELRWSSAPAMTKRSLPLTGGS